MHIVTVFIFIILQIHINYQFNNYNNLNTTIFINLIMKALKCRNLGAGK